MTIRFHKLLEKFHKETLCDQLSTKCKSIAPPKSLPRAGLMILQIFRIKETDLVENHFFKRTNVANIARYKT